MRYILVYDIIIYIYVIIYCMIIYIYMIASIYTSMVVHTRVYLSYLLSHSGTEPCITSIYATSCQHSHSEAVQAKGPTARNPCYKWLELDSVDTEDLSELEIFGKSWPHKVLFPTFSR